MREDAVVAIRLVEKVNHLYQSFNGGIPADPATLYGHDGCHDAKTGAADGAVFASKCSFTKVRFVVCFIDKVPVIIGLHRSASFPCQAAYRMGVMPEKTEGLFLNHFQQGRVG